MGAMADGRVIVPLIRSLHVILGCGPAEPAEGPQPPALLSAEQRRVAARALSQCGTAGRTGSSGAYPRVLGSASGNG